MSEQKTATFSEWALVELFGHQRITGLVSDATLAGGAFLRVDVPQVDEQPAYTRFFGPSAIYSISPVTEDIARQMCRAHRNVPVERYQLPQIADKVEAHQEPSADESLF